MQLKMASYVWTFPKQERENGTLYLLRRMQSLLGPRNAPSVPCWPLFPDPAPDQISYKPSYTVVQATHV